jgi:transposase
MDATLVELPVQADSASRSSAELSALVDKLLGEVGQLRREVGELRQEAGYWKGMFAQAKQKNEKLQKQVDELQAENRQLKDKLYGTKSEKKSSQDRSNQLEDPSQPHSGPKRSRGHQPNTPGPKRRDHSHLPVVEEPVELPDDQCPCPKCGKLREVMAETEDSELIEIDVRAYRRRIRRKRYRTTCNCPDIPRTLAAPAPPKLIPKGRYGISVWVHVLLDKFASYRATANLIEQLKVYDLALPPGTVAQGLKRLVPLLHPIYQALLERNGRSVYRQADETRWPVFVEVEGKKGHRWWLWAFLGEDTVVFRIASSRGHEIPQEHYPEELRAFLMVDRYSAYKAMVQVKSGVVVLVFCWAHVRRDFIAVGKGWPELVDWALAWLQRIREIYRLNRERLRHAPQTSAFEEHDTALREAIEMMDKQAIDELTNPKLREPCRKALKSLQSHWSGLTVFVDDLKIPMDNNASERTVRGPAMGRKNYYGSGSLWSVSLAATMFSILATLKRWNLNPLHWLTWYLESCAAAGGKPPSSVESFLPWNLTEKRREELTGPVPPVASIDSS